MQNEVESVTKTTNTEYREHNSMQTHSANWDIMTKELSKICKFFVLVCLSTLFSWDKSSLVLSLDILLKLRTVLFRNVLHK